MDFTIITPPLATVKEKFEAKLAEYEQKNQGSQRKPWTPERISEVINKVRKAKVSMVSKQARTSMDYYWLAKYDTMLIANEEYLIFKRNTPDDPTVRILPRNEYFGTLEDIHKACGHGGRDKMLHAIKSRYYIPRKAIEIYLALCTTCEMKKTLPKKGIVTKPIVSQDFNIRGQVDLMDFQSCPDGEYKWLLNYQDNATKFVSLRPLKTKKSQEVAMELMKIFMIFGAPYILQSDNGREFTAKIIEKLTSMWPECKIVHGSPRHPQTQGSIERSNQDVENILKMWMSDNNSTNWSVGCYHVQYKKNASFHRIIGRSPYKALFGCNPKAGLDGSVIPISILNNIQTEEQLQDLSLQKSTSEIDIVDSVPEPVNSEIEINEYVIRNIKVPAEIKCGPNVELKPCCSKNLKDESAANKNKSHVQEQPGDNNLYCTETEELENLEPNFTCIVCHKDCTGAHTCRSCGNVVHVICGFYDEENEGYGSKILCFLCKSEEKIQSQRREAHKGTNRAAEKMLNNTAKKLPPLSIGQTVIISIPKVDRGPLDTQNIRGKVVDFRNGVYKVGTKSGILKNWFARHEMQFSTQEIPDIDIPDVHISLREAVSRESLFGGQGFQKCICKPAQKQCCTKRCACYKKNVLCSSKCHNSLSCVNK